MIIDFHVHPVTKNLLDASMEFFRKTNAQRAVEWYSSLNLSIKGLIEEMDRAGVDKVVILGLDYNIDLPLLKISNDRIAEIARQYPERFIGFASVCPTEIGKISALAEQDNITVAQTAMQEYPKQAQSAQKLEQEIGKITERKVQDCVLELRRAVNELNLKGLKLLPPYQHFYPNDPRVFPIYEEAQKLKIPILIHTGGEDFPGLVRYCNPVYLDDIAKRFPELIIIAAHMGSYPFGVWFEEMMMTADENPNVFVDLAALRPRELIDLNLLERAIQYIGSEKILFGSDYPVVFDYPMRKAVETVINADISENDRENILGRNAQRILKI